MYRYKTKEELEISMGVLKRLVAAIENNDQAQVSAILINQQPYVNELVDTQSTSSGAAGTGAGGGGKSPLMIAAERGNVAVVRMLLEYTDIDVNVEDCDCWTALTFALKERHEEVATLLIEADTTLLKPDKNNWTPLTWACFLDLPEIVVRMLDKGAMLEHKDSFGVSCLSWAAGRGNIRVVSVLLQRMSSSIDLVNSPDKYGSTPLLWTCRKGHLECAQMLLEHGAEVNMSGMNGWTPLIASVTVNHQRLVDLLLKSRPANLQLDSVDKSGLTALMHASKQGSVEIADALLSAGCSLNKVDQKGDSALIHAVKHAHKDLVQLLVEQGADVDLVGSENKVALMIAIERNETEIAQMLIKQGQAKVNIRCVGAGGDTCLLKATKKANLKLVELLLEHGANVLDTDAEGNTALHIAVRGNMGHITQALLSNPKHGRILYMPNKAGETPYNMDASRNEGRVLNQVFGARRFLPAEEDETSHQLLGYHLYSASLADFFSEPSLPLPITLGLFARWGSGKSHFLPRLESDMKSFCLPMPVSHQSDKRWIIYLISLLAAACVVTFGCFAPCSLAIKLLIVFAGLILFLLPVLIIELIRCCARRFAWAHLAIDKADNCLAYFHLLLCITFLRPPNSRGRRLTDTSDALPMRYLFSDRTKVAADVSEEAAVVRLVASLSAEAELEFGFLAFRLLQASLRSNHSRQCKFKLTLCIPTFIHLVVFVVLVLTIGFLAMIDAKRYMIECIVVACIAFLILLFHLPGIVRICRALHMSQYKMTMQLADRKQSSNMTEEAFIHQLKHKVECLSRIVTAIDQFAMRSSRMVIFLDGLDRCDQHKVVRVLEMSTVLFCYPSMPFIVIYCLDPVSVLKSIEHKISNSENKQNASSYDYMRTIIHLPFYFPDKTTESLFLESMKRLSTFAFGQSQDQLSANVENSPPRASSRALAGIPAGSANDVHQKHSAASHYMSCMLSTWNLTKMLASDRDCLYDLNPRELQRLINVISVTGRLLRAYRINFDWKKLAYWVRLTEKWSYHVSWMLFYLVRNAARYKLTTSFKEVFDDVKQILPAVKNDKMFENDGERRFLDIFLSEHHPTLTISDVKNFYPHTVNLDPALKNYIQIAPRSESCGDIHELMQQQDLISQASMPGRRFSWRGSALLNRVNSVCNSGAAAEEHNRDARLNVRSPLYRRNQTSNQNSARAHRKTKPLIEYSLEDVCDALAAEIEGIDRGKLFEYRTVLKAQNINGRVLTVCDMEDLKEYLGMSFGDWNLFKQWVYTKRMLDSEEETEAETTETTRSLNGDDNGGLAIVTTDDIPGSHSTSERVLRSRGDPAALDINRSTPQESSSAAEPTEHSAYVTAEERSRAPESPSTHTNTGTYSAFSESTISPQENKQVRSPNANHVRQPRNPKNDLKMLNVGVSSKTSLQSNHSPSGNTSATSSGRFTVTVADIESPMELDSTTVPSPFSNQSEGKLSFIFEQDFLRNDLNYSGRNRDSCIDLEEEDVNDKCRRAFVTVHPHGKLKSLDSTSTSMDSPETGEVSVVRRVNSNGRRRRSVSRTLSLAVKFQEEDAKSLIDDDGASSLSTSTQFLQMMFDSVDEEPSSTSLSSLKTKPSQSFIQKLHRSISSSNFFHSRNIRTQSSSFSMSSHSPLKSCQNNEQSDSDRMPICLHDSISITPHSFVTSLTEVDSCNNQSSIV